MLSSHFLLNYSASRSLSMATMKFSRLSFSSTTAALLLSTAVSSVPSIHGFAHLGHVPQRNFGSRMFLLDKLFLSTSSSIGSSTGRKYPVVADDSVMKPKAHGTSDKPVQKNLRWNCDYETADRICNFNRHYAEFSGYWQTTNFLDSIRKEEGPVQFYDSVTGALLFTAPVGRTMDEFLVESKKHGWPSFRDAEVNWDTVRCLANGECVSITGTHLGHNIPDGSGNRYCINLVSVAGQPAEEVEKGSP